MNNKNCSRPKPLKDQKSKILTGTRQHISEPKGQMLLVGRISWQVVMFTLQPLLKI
jgi:hypothetical protein